MDENYSENDPFGADDDDVQSQNQDEATDVPSGTTSVEQQPLDQDDVIRQDTINSIENDLVEYDVTADPEAGFNDGDVLIPFTVNGVTYDKIVVGTRVKLPSVVVDMVKGYIGDNRRPVSTDASVTDEHLKS